MRDSDIIESFTAPSGILFEHVRTSADVRADFPWMAETLWSATHPNGSIYGMGVGNTPEAAEAKLLANFPELRRAA